VIRTVLRWLLRWLLRVRVEGDARALEQGPRLVVSNHDSLLDGVLLALFLPNSPIVVVSPAVLTHALVRLCARAVPFVVLDPARPLALKSLIRSVRQGKTLAIFPQGRPTVTGGLMKIYDSAGLIAAHAGARIVPVHIAGTLYTPFATMRGAYPRKLRSRVVLTVLEPVELPPLETVPPRQRRRRLADEMLRVMQRMMFDARPRQTLFEAFLDSAALYGRSTHIIEDARGQPESYSALVKASLAVGRLVSRETGEGENVGVLLPNISTTVAVVLGLTAAGRPCAMLNYTSGAEAMRAACVAAGVKTVVTSKRFVRVARLESAITALTALRIVYLEELRDALTLRDKLWLITRALPRPRSVITQRDPSATAVVLFTSGSEARSKGVAISHDALLANMAQMRAVIDFGPNDKYLNALPMYHTYGLIACTLMPLIAGTRLFLYTTPLHYKVIPELAYTRDCTYIFGTSTFLGHYARQGHPYDFRSVRVVVSGGEKLNLEVAELWLRKFGLRVMEGYGATECGPAMSLNTPLCYRADTVGRFLPGIEWHIVPVPGISRGGELHVRSPNLMSGYYFYEQPELLHPPRSEVGVGWYNTGDIVDVDSDGFVTILGRVKRFAKIAGEMVSLELVERIAYAASAEHKHAATVEQVSGHGESTVLFTTDPRLDRLTLVKAAREIEAKELAVARRIVKVASLPLLGSGKTDYVTLGSMTTTAFSSRTGE
jgi:acyl-[acyl-carrier-protein]-phospholipid O-acyltransferase / long-chain-fatty-acid--[acyl-carrier-protein] ligase